MLNAASPFVLLDDAAGARLFREPVEIIEAADWDAVRPALEALRAAGERGLTAAGFLSYEAGHALEPKLAPLREPHPADAPPLLWFGLFSHADEVADVPALLPDPLRRGTACRSR
jgi:hypothetical protein